MKSKSIAGDAKYIKLKNERVQQPPTSTWRRSVKKSCVLRRVRRVVLLHGRLLQRRLLGRRVQKRKPRPERRKS
jgi:hypothetical protein